ncbi:unnamed protein product, partial [Ixodes persulcatus]
MVEEDICEIMEQAGIVRTEHSAVDLVNGLLGFWEPVVVVPGVVAARPPGVDLVLVHAEDEDVLWPHLLSHLHVGSVQSADGQCSIQLHSQIMHAKKKKKTHHELHVSCAGGLCACGGDLLAQVCGRDDLLGQADPVVLQEDHLQLVPHHGVVVHHIAHCYDQLDDLLRYVIRVAHTYLAADHDGTGH